MTQSSSFNTSSKDSVYQARLDPKHITTAITLFIPPFWKNNTLMLAMRVSKKRATNPLFITLFSSLHI
jgi:hypothetical protein